jgi:hypothetical protein
MAYLDFKITSWRRVYIPDELVEEVQNRLTNGDVDTPYDLLGEEGHYTLDLEDDELCEEPMGIEENGGCHTQEIFTDTGEMIWTNV